MSYYHSFKCPYCGRCHRYNSCDSKKYVQTVDYGPDPFVFNIEEETKKNTNFRTALWTGCHLQLTLMCIPVGGEIGLEIHHDVDQFIRVEQGRGLTKIGHTKACLDYQVPVCSEDALIIPAGTWHNLVNTGNCPLKVYSIYAPPQHPFNTVYETKAIADTSEHE